MYIYIYIIWRGGGLVRGLCIICMEEWRLGAGSAEATNSECLNNIFKGACNTCA